MIPFSRVTFYITSSAPKGTRIKTIETSTAVGIVLTGAVVVEIAP